MCDDGGWREIGGAKRDRTADLLHAMQALSQLSYGPVPMRTGLVVRLRLLKLRLRLWQCPDR